MNKEFITDISEILVSIIIPAYNVEKYIEKCLDSIFEQDHKNIEVIIINDGSTDNTGKVIDAYIERETRARVLHTPNSGVSSARNSGIKESKGDYLIFVDGDDYLSNDNVSYMLNLVIESKSDFCISKSCYTKKTEKQTEKEYFEVLSSEEATALLLSPDVVVGCWNKIYKRSLIVSNNICFSSSLFYGEGLTFIIDVAQASKNVGVGNRKVYFYRKNNESSATTKFDINKIYNGEKALIDISSKLSPDSEIINTMFKYHLSLFRLAALVKIKSNKLEKKYIDDYNIWLRYVRGNALKFILNNQLSLYRKTLIIAGSISPSTIAILDRVRCKRIINNSVDD
ncbi:TPA: glycosyltransferase family 2 protein [Photobacterium damselae]